MGSKQTVDAVNGSVARNTAWNRPESIQAALEKTSGKVIPAAKLLGVSRASLRHRIAELKAGTSDSNGNGHLDGIAAVFRSPLYSLDILKPENWQDKRPCWYCGTLFAPLRANNWEQHFCSDEHKVAFNKWGYLPFEKLLLGMHAEIRRQIKALSLESLVESVVSKLKPELVRLIRTGETEQRDYIRKTVALMISNPERVRKTLEAVDSGEEIPE